jgi:signal transduction histidine kinase
MTVVAKEKNILLEVEIPGGAEIFTGDYDRIKQMLVIVIDNAFKFTPAGGSVWFAAARKGEDFLISVRDSGEGIEEEKLPFIFDRFYKTDASHNIEGTGLGLAIAKHIVRAHGGTIRVSSELGHGCTFAFSLPQEIAVPTALVRGPA